MNCTETFHIITGEYPPARGGVADYTQRVGHALAASGATVHVWTRSSDEVEDDPSTDRLLVHRILNGWSRSDLALLARRLDQFEGPRRRLLVQHTPNAWGYRGLNLGFARWLLDRQRRGDEVEVMFHEVWYPLRLRDKPTRWGLALGHRWLTRIIMKACTFAFVSIPAWEPLLRASERGPRKPVTWLPVPSNIEVVEDEQATAALRARIAPRGQAVIGSFGTFGGMIASMLSAVLPRLLESRDDRVILLFGRGSEAYAETLATSHPALASRIISAGSLSPAEVSTYLQVCDVLIQPYPDGLSSRRTTLMAGLAHGVPTVSNLGALSEPVWLGSKALALALEPDPSALVEAAERVIALSPQGRNELGEAGRELYQRAFSVGRIVDLLQSPRHELAI